MKHRAAQTLSVCLIVKNEEQLLGDCLESIRGIADQLVILDTGSTDRTLEIAQSYQAELHHFAWSNDFSAARNESIKYATGDWILWIDADERLVPDSIESLKRLLRFEAKPVIYKVRIKNIKEDGANYTLSDAHRLFTNHRRIKFSGRIHEQISPSAKQVGAQERDCPVVLDHLGYGFTGADKANKQTRNRDLLEAQVQENPNSAYAHFTLAHNYKVDENLSGAEQHYLKAIELQQFDSSMEATLLNSYADTLLDLGRTEEAPAWVERSLKLHRMQNAAYFLKYRIAMASKKYDDAEVALKTIQSNQEHIQHSGSDISTDLEISSLVIWKTLGDLHVKMEKWSEAAGAYSAGLKESENSVELLKDLFKVQEKVGDWSAALEVLGKLVTIEGELPAYINAIAAILIRMEAFEAALQTYLRLNQLQPGDAGTRRKIAALYAKLGQVENAREWLS